MKLGDTFAGRLPKPAQPAQPDTWLCPHCGQDVVIDDVFPSLDGERILTMWRCAPCEVVAVTPDAVKAPPSDFVTMLKSNAFIFQLPQKVRENENHENGVPQALNPPNPPL